MKAHAPKLFRTSVGDEFTRLSPTGWARLNIVQRFRSHGRWRGAGMKRREGDGLKLEMAALKPAAEREVSDG